MSQSVESVSSERRYVSAFRELRRRLNRRESSFPAVFRLLSKAVKSNERASSGAPPRFAPLLLSTQQLRQLRHVGQQCAGPLVAGQQVPAPAGSRGIVSVLRSARVNVLIPQPI